MTFSIVSGTQHTVLSSVMLSAVRVMFSSVIMLNDVMLSAVLCLVVSLCLVSWRTDARVF